MSLRYHMFCQYNREPTTNFALHSAFPDRRLRLLSFSAALTSFLSKRWCLSPKRTAALGTKVAIACRYCPQMGDPQALYVATFPALSCYYAPKPCAKTPESKVHKHSRQQS